MRELVCVCDLTSQGGSFDRPAAESVLSFRLFSSSSGAASNIHIEHL